MAQDQARAVKVDYDPALIETIVRRRVDAASDDDRGWISDYRAELDEIYELPEKSREAAFAALDRRYFQRIGIPSIVDECLAERSTVMTGAASVSLIMSQNRWEEGVDVTRDRRLVIRVRPAALENSGAFRARIRRELIQAADCLNPAFGHAPEILDGMLPSEKERVREGMSILWALSAQTRLCSWELQSAKDFPINMVEELEQMRQKTLGAFGGAGADEIAAILSGLPDRPPTFREMLDFCGRYLGSEKVSAGICDLCRFPSDDAVLFSGLSPNLQTGLKTEFPELRNSSPICRRCIERSEITQGETR